MDLRTKQVIVRGYMALAVLLLLVATGCLRPRASSLYSDDTLYNGPLFISLKASPTANQFDVLYAAAPNTASLGICSGATATTCSATGPGYTALKLTYDSGTKRFFAATTPLAVTEGMQLAIVAADATGKLLHQRLVKFTSSGAGAASPAGLQTITNSTVWKDTDGNEIRAQGGGMFKVADTFYWIGSSMANSIRCYSSKDLAHWKFEGDALKKDGWLGRPDVVYNDTTKKYVMIIEWSNGNGRNIPAYLTSDTPCGSYTWARAETDVFGSSMGDHSVFKDADGRAYLVYTFDEGGQNASMGVAELNADYLGLKAQAYKVRNGNGSCEAGNIFKAGPTYYLLSSGCNWWASTATMYRTSTDLHAWSDVKVMPTKGQSNNSFNTQTDFVITVTGSQGTSYIYAGDRYSQYTHDGVGLNAWYPLSIDSAGLPTLEGHEGWAIDVGTGLWAEK